MKTETRCWVIDDDGKVLIAAGEVHCFVSKVHKSPQTHVIVKYYENLDDAMVEENYILKVFPIDRVFFQERE